jgi:hypothetical protein
MPYPIQPVYQLPTGKANTFTPDPQTGTTGALTYMREAPYINAWIQASNKSGGGRQVQLPWITALRMQCAYEDFQLLPVAGTFNRQPKAGSRIYTITLTRYQGIYQPFLALVRAAYMAPQNVDIRLDRYPVDLLLSYAVQAGGAAAGNDTSTALAEETWQFTQAWAAGGWETGLVSSATSASDETITFLASTMIYIAPIGIQTTDMPQPASGYGIF